MMIKIIEFIFTFILSWIFIASYLKYDMNKELKSKGDVIFSNINIIKVQKTTLFKNVLFVNVNDEIIRIIGVNNDTLSYMLNNRGVIVYTRMCVYGLILLHNGFKFYSLKH